MQSRSVIRAVAILTAASDAAVAAESEVASSEKIAVLIAQLRHDRFAERDAANSIAS